MELDVSLGNDSLSITIDNPFRLDLDSVMKKIEDFLSEKGTDLDCMDIKGLIPRMVKGIAGCEKGCPANAKSLVSQGFKNFQLNYIEGGILSATASTGDGKVLSLKMFPEF
ncbi:MAG: hypothetical protein AB1632_00650 [Nitrospirota bacterium]